jgi:hypothetical protein
VHSFVTNTVKNRAGRFRFIPEDTKSRGLEPIDAQNARSSSARVPHVTSPSTNKQYRRYRYESSQQPTPVLIQFLYSASAMGGKLADSGSSLRMPRISPQMLWTVTDEMPKASQRLCS